MSSRPEKIVMDISLHRTCCSRLTRQLTYLNRKRTASPQASSCSTMRRAINVALTMHCQQERCRKTQTKAGLTERTDQRCAMEHLALIKYVKSFITHSTIRQCLAGSRAWSRSSASAAFGLKKEYLPNAPDSNVLPDARTAAVDVSYSITPTSWLRNQNSKNSLPREVTSVTFIQNSIVS